MATPDTQQLNCQAYLSYGSVDGQEQVLLNYNEATSTVGFQSSIIPVELAASAVNTSVDLSGYVDTATFIGVLDRNNTGVSVGVGTTDKMNVAANGFILWKNGAATPPTLKISNTSTTAKAFIQILIMGTSA